MDATHTPLRELVEKPFELLQEMEQRATARYASVADTSTWVGVGLRVGSQQYVVPREQIREVMKKPELTRIPGANPWLRGLANVRGQLMPIVDLKMLCGAPATLADRQTRVVLVNDEQVPMAVIVDEVFGFRRFAATERQPLDDHQAQPDLSEFLDGAYRRDGALWPVLSFFKVIQSSRLLSAV
jgi:twitching motility protein PilI